MKKRIVSLILAVVLMFTLSVTAFALSDEKETVTPRMTYISSIYTSFDVSTFSCEVVGDIVCYSSVTSINIKLYLQKESDGVWSTVKTWEQRFYDTDAYLAGTATISPFSTYRLKAVYTVYSGSNSETETIYRYE